MSLKEDHVTFGCFRRGQNIILLFKRRSKVIQNKFLERLVLNVESDDVKLS
jgi:hypothetical protein